MRRAFARNPVLGPTAALLVVMIFFSVATDTFLNVDNFSLIVQQSVVIGTLALGQTLIILTAGIDLANAAIAVFGTLLLTKLTIGGVPPFIAILAGSGGVHVHRDDLRHAGHPREAATVHRHPGHARRGDGRDQPLQRRHDLPRRRTGC